MYCTPIECGLTNTIATPYHRPLPDYSEVQRYPNYSTYDLFTLKTYCDTVVGEWKQGLEVRHDESILKENDDENKGHITMTLQVFYGASLVKLSPLMKEILNEAVELQTSELRQWATLFFAGNDYWYNSILPLLPERFDGLVSTMIYDRRLLVDLSNTNSYTEYFFNELIPLINERVAKLRNEGVGTHNLNDWKLESIPSEYALSRATWKDTRLYDDFVEFLSEREDTPLSFTVPIDVSVRHSVAKALQPMMLTFCGDLVIVPEVNNHDEAVRVADLVEQALLEPTLCLVSFTSDLSNVPKDAVVYRIIGPYQYVVSQEV